MVTPDEEIILCADGRVFIFETLTTFPMDTEPFVWQGGTDVVNIQLVPQDHLPEFIVALHADGSTLRMTFGEFK